MKTSLDRRSHCLEIMRMIIAKLRDPTKQAKWYPFHGNTLGNIYFTSSPAKCRPILFRHRVEYLRNREILRNCASSSVCILGHLLTNLLAVSRRSPLSAYNREIVRFWTHFIRLLLTAVLVLTDVDSELCGPSFPDARRISSKILQVAIKLLKPTVFNNLKVNLDSLPKTPPLPRTSSWALPLHAGRKLHNRPP